jgi:hypothetical protein
MAFGGLGVATVAAFFIIQHLKVSTPLIAGTPAPIPATINPASGTCIGPTAPGAASSVNSSCTSLSFYLLYRPDNVDVNVMGANGRPVATLASGLFMRAIPYPHFATRTFTWHGRVYGGGLAPPGCYYVRVRLRRQDRTIDITDSEGDREWIRVNSSTPACHGT